MFFFKTNFEREQRQLCKKAGYAVHPTDKGLWARHKSHPEGYRFTLPESYISTLKKGGATEADIDLTVQGWFGISEGTNFELSQLIPAVKCGLSNSKVDFAKVGLTFLPHFNANAYVGSGFALLHAPLVFSLDWMGTFGYALNVLRPIAHHDPKFPPMIECIEQSVSKILDFVCGLEPWTGPQISQVVKVHNDALGPDERWARTGYDVAATQRIWILLHEFGHLLFGHGRAVGKDAWRQEFEADAFATQNVEAIVDNAGHVSEVPAEVAVPLLFDVLEAADTRDPRKSATHPPSSAWRERIQAATPHWQSWGAGRDDSPFKNL